MGALSLVEANKLVDQANARAKAAEAEVRDRRDRVEQLEQELGRRVRERDHFMVERDAARQQVDRELANLARVAKQLDEANARIDRLITDVDDRRITIDTLRDELQREKLLRIQLEAQRKAVGDFIRDAIAPTTEATS